MVKPGVVSSVLYSIRWALLKSSNDSEDLMMYLNQPVPLAYYHLLEVMVVVVTLVGSVAFVPSLLWFSVVISPLLTFFFFGFFSLGTTMLMDPFVKESGFDTESFLTSTILNMQSLETNVPLGSFPLGGGAKQSSGIHPLDTQFAAGFRDPNSEGFQPSPRQLASMKKVS